MHKIYLSLYLICMPFFLTAQTTIIAQQDFDESALSWNFNTDIAFFNNGNRGFFGIHDGDGDNDAADTGIAANASEISFQNFENDFLFINDLNNDPGLGTSEEATLTFESLSIENYTAVTLSFDYEVIGFENADYIRYQIMEDGIASAIMELPKNGQGTISLPIQNNTEHISLLIIMHQNALNDYAAIDNIALKGLVKNPCSELFISEYVEGNSSNQFNNNYLEIYNPTNEDVNLENYDLQIYAGANTNPYSTLQLSGTITAYGTFLIKDTTENLGVIANLSTNSAVLNFTGNDKIALRHNENIIDLIGVIGEDIDFAKDVTLRRKSHIQMANNQYNMQEWDIYQLENISDLNQHTSSCSGAIPEIQVLGNNININDDSIITATENNTYFGQADVASQETIIKYFNITNTGNAALNLNNISIFGSDASSFTLSSFQSQQVLAGETIEFYVSFQPSSMGVKNAVIQIDNNDASENPFQFVIQAEGTGISNSPIIISQYYNGNGNNKWLEVTNIGNIEIEEETYYLAIYRNEDAVNPLGNTPSAKRFIPNLSPGQSVLFRASLNVNTPAYALNTGEITTNVCTFTGDDIIVISTSEDESCWQNRVDIIGENSLWGANTNFIKKYGCEDAPTNTKFKLEDWINTTIEDVNNATVGQNIRLGEHSSGSTIFNEMNQWTNGAPDRYKSAIINQNYNTAIHGSIEACSVTINEGVVLEVQANQYLYIENNLIVNGTLNIANEGSLVMMQDDGWIQNTGEINIYKNTAEIKQYDYTYWSSPVATANINTVFANSPQNSFYFFNTEKYQDLDNNQEDDNGDAWQTFSGNMEIGKGYTAMAPNTSPFQNIQSVIFTGTPNNGIYTTPIYTSENIMDIDDDWNLIGNPYPSAIDIEALYNHANNANVLTGSFYFWTHQTTYNSEENGKYSADDYAIYTVGTGGVAAVPNGTVPNGYISSGQGFFVEALQAGNIEWNNSIRVNNQNNLFFKSTEKNKSNLEEKDRIWLNLSNENGAFSQILIGFLPESSKNYTPKFDGIRMEGSNFLSFYSFKNDKKLAIQGATALQGTETIPLGFHSKINESTILKVAIDKLEGGLKEKPIYLFDAKTNAFHDLSKSSYEFTLEKEGIYNNRFSLHFTTAALNFEQVQHQKEGLLVTKNSDEIIISTFKHTSIKGLKIFDLLGRTVFSSNHANTEVKLYKSQIQANTIYIVQAKLENGKTIRKKVFL